MAVSANRLELLQIVDAVAREKSIDRSIVLASMEDAMQKAARSRYGQETEVRAEINPKTGEIRFSRLLLVVDEVENEATQMTLTEAQKKNPSAQIGDWIAESLPPFDYGRIPAQASKQVLVQKIREAERDKQYDVYKDRIGDIINGAVKRVEYGNVVVDLGGAGAGEAVVRRDELIPREMFRPGDRIRAYVYDVRREARGPQIFLSRTHPQFTARLFAQEVPEIYDGIVEIKSVARDPGSRAKIAVVSNDSSIDPVGACVGMRGSRVQAVVNEQQGEKIDIIPWSSGRRDLHRQCVAAGRGHEGGARRGLDPHRGRRSRRSAVAGDRPARAERAPRLATDRLGHRHLDGSRGIRAPAEGIRRADADLHGRARRRRDGRPASGFGRLPHGRRNRLCRAAASWLRSKASTPIRRPKSRRARRDTLPGSKPSLTTSERRSGCPTISRRLPGLTTPMLVKLGENGVKTLEDLADCASDDLVGWTDGDVAKPGFLDRVRRVAGAS